MDAPPGTVANEGISAAELRLAARNHALPLEALRYDITPAGLHYLLIHYDIPAVDPAAFRLEVGGAVERPLSLSLDDLRARERVALPVTFECAGNGRALLDPRPVSQPWLTEAIGTAEWGGTPLAPLLEEAGVRAGAVEALFEGLDRGIEGAMAAPEPYERSLALADAGDALLAYEMNGAELPPQHGFPLRLVVPGWYGMTNVKWLTRITLLERALRRLPERRRLPHVRRRRPARRGGHPDAAAVADGAAGRARLHDPRAPARAGTGHARGARLVGPRADRARGGVHGRRRDLRRRGAGGAARAGRLARLALRLGRAARRARALLARHRRGRQRAAARGALEPQGLREQRGRARSGRSSPGSASA